MKVALLGGGSFRAPLVWESLRGLGVDSFVLYDVDDRNLRRIKVVMDGLERERPGGPPATTTTTLEPAVDGADIILCAIRVGGLDARVIDETIPLRYGVLGQETVGPGGICFALRTVPVMLDLAERVAHRAPDAWFLNLTNPAGLVTEAIRTRLGERAIGICDAPANLCARVAAALGRKISDLRFDYAGLNHLGWLLSVTDRDGELLHGLLRDDPALASIFEVQLLGIDYARRTGTIPNEYLVYYETPNAVVRSFRRAGATRGEVLRDEMKRFYSGSDDALRAWQRARDARFDSYMAEAWESPSGVTGEEPTEGPGEAGYAAIAAAFVRAARGKDDATLILDVANRGRLPWLDDEAVIEVPCRVAADRVIPEAGCPLPAAHRDLVARVKEVERLTIAAAVRGSRAVALEALAAHPVVPSRDVAGRILDGYLAALPDLAERLR